MKVLVTGGAGYIGSVTSELLLNQGHEVVVFDNFERGHRDAVDTRARVIEGDLRERDSIIAAMRSVRPDAVVHFAAFALVGESMQDPQLYFRNNVVGGINLADAMKAAGVPKIIFSSTCATYGVPETMPMHEDLPQKPTNPYGESKLLFRKRFCVGAMNATGPDLFFCAISMPQARRKKFGEHHDPESHIIPNVLFVAQGRQEKVMIFGDDYPTPDGTCVRDYIHIADLAQAHILALEKDVSGPFNLGNGDGYSVKQVVDVAREVTGKPIKAEVAPRRPGDPPRLIASATKAHTVLGWKPKYPDLRTIIEHAWKWHQANPRGYAK
ncbi:MAG: UDP-glucose 4-epimerase GalE [Kiritimatiellae bacterium]|nr:UDP-glucose 4-epimerase GalE [Kiritimatiellia bacterium]